MHPEADAFLDAIFDRPADDVPRLVYADWLQEHGQESYAQFIRLQCAVARETPESNGGNRLREEIESVWTSLDKEWQPATRVEWLVTARDWAPLGATHFHRGFLQTNIPIAAGLFARCNACWAWMPHPDNVLAILPGDETRSLAASTRLQRVRVVRCGDLSAEPYAPMLAWGAVKRAGPKSINPLLRSPYLSRVHTLDLSRVPVRRSTIDILLNAPNLASVKELQLGFDDSGECDPDEVVPLLKKRYSRVYRW